jgi:L-malate glycosyltransferase
MASSPHTIVHLITSLGGGGTENFLYQVVSRAPTGCKTTVACLKTGGAVEERLRRLGADIRGTPTPWHVTRLLEETKPDLLHTCLFWGNQIGRWAGRRTRVPRIVSSQRAIHIWEKPWHRILDRWTLPWCQAVIVNSLAAQALVNKRLEGRSKVPQIIRIPNGLDFARFAPAQRAEARQRFNLPPEAVVGGTMGRLHYEKGAEKIPALAKKLLREDPRLVLLVAGIGPLENQLKMKTREESKRIRFVGWQEDAVSFLNSLDFFWLLSREESFPQALLEASGMALPWAAPDIGDVAELKKSGAAGILYPVNDVAAAAQVCRELVTHLPEWSRKAAAARPALEAIYSLDRMSAAFYGFLDRLA